MADIARMTVTLPADMAAAVKGAVEGGDAASSSEVVREALRDWKIKRALQWQELAALKADSDKGLADVAAGRVKKSNTGSIKVIAGAIAAVFFGTVPAQSQQIVPAPLSEVQTFALGEFRGNVQGNDVVLTIVEIKDGMVKGNLLGVRVNRRGTFNAAIKNGSIEFGWDNGNKYENIRPCADNAQDLCGVFGSPFAVNTPIRLKRPLS